MYKAERTDALPPQTVRLPRNRPLSRLWGATPTSEAISLRFNRPSSGRCASSMVDATGPTPGTLRSRSSLACQRGLDWMNRSSSSLRSLSSFSSQAMCCLIPGWTCTVAFGRRFLSAVIIPTTWRRRAMSPRSSCSLSPGRGRTGGFTASPNRASTTASMASVFASLPVARAKSRTWRGLTTATGTPAAASSPATTTSDPPDASSTARVGSRAATRFLNAVMPSGSLATSHTSPDGKIPKTNSDDDTSTPKYVLSASNASPIRR